MDTIERVKVDERITDWIDLHSVGEFVWIDELLDFLSSLAAEQKADHQFYKADGSVVGFEDMCEWWLQHYEGIEHMTEGGTTSPETWYTVTTILKRSMQKIKDGKRIEVKEVKDE
jgi:hypothetical protein